MHPEIRARWVAALRSGEYAQGRGSLRDGNQYCCLGVLCDLAVKDGVIGEPTLFGLRYYYGECGDSELLPFEVIQWAELEEADPTVNGISLTVRNDSFEDPWNFNRLADLIEKHL